MIRLPHRRHCHCHTQAHHLPGQSKWPSFAALCPNFYGYSVFIDGTDERCNTISSPSWTHISSSLFCFCRNFDDDVHRIPLSRNINICAILCFFRCDEWHSIGFSAFGYRIDRATEWTKKKPAACWMRRDQATLLCVSVFFLLLSAWRKVLKSSISIRCDFIYILCTNCV